MKKLTTLLLSCLVLLSLCVSPLLVNAEEITDFVDYETQAREIETFNVLFSQTNMDLQVLCNLVDSLLTNDNHGALKADIAKEWGTEDGGKTWTFNLRDDVKWVDYEGNEKADCVAEDWLWGLEWVLNFYKNNAANTSMPIQMIEGASEYYEYTKDLPEEEALALGIDKLKEMVGIEAVDDYTLKYTCTDNIPYFDTLATYACLYPLSGKLLEEIGVEGYKSIDNETMWYNGPYTMTSYIHQNEKVLTKNPLYFDQDAKRFDTVTIKMVESPDIAFQLYQTGEIDRVALTEANLQTISRNESNEFHDFLVERRPDKYSYQFHFCFDKNLENGDKDENWNKAIRNENFRLAWYNGLDLTTYLSRLNALNPLGCTNICYSFPNLVFTSDGRDYTDLVKEKIGLEESLDSYVRYNEEKFTEYKAKALEELEAEGVEFPVQVDYYIKSGNQTAADSAVVLKQTIEDSLGADFVQLNIKEFVSSQTQEVRDPQLASFYINGWGADYGDPYNFLVQEIYGDDNAYYAQKFSHINEVPEDTPLVEDYKTFTEMVKEANAITDDMDARYAKFAEAEAFMLGKVFVLPLYYNIGWELTTVNQYSKVYVPYGCQQGRYINWDTYSEGVTSEMAAEFAEAYAAE